MKKFFLSIFLLSIGLLVAKDALGSWSEAVSEVYVEGDSATVYQFVETTVNDQTVKKESSQPGKLELKMEQTEGGEPTVTFFEEAASSSPRLTPTTAPEPAKNQADEPGLRSDPAIKGKIANLINRINQFLKKMFSFLSG